MQCVPRTPINLIVCLHLVLLSALELFHLNLHGTDHILKLVELYELFNFLCILKRDYLTVDRLHYVESCLGGRLKVY